MSIPCAVLFDMDGTLLMTEKLATPAFTRTFAELRRRRLWDGPTPSPEQMTHVLGMTLAQLWDTLLPGAADDVKRIADEIMLEQEIALLKEGVTDLYPGVREQLRRLRDSGIALFVASNGLEAYIEVVCQTFRIKDWFVDLYSAGRFGTRSKSDLVAKLLADYRVKHAVMVGDRRSDVEAGKANGLFTIGCDFGFAAPGELEGADVIIHSFDELHRHLPFPLVETGR